MTRVDRRDVMTMTTTGRGRAADLGVLALRLGAGGLLAGHGAQKLFGSFGGPGLDGLGGFLETMGLRPGKRWATLAGVSEFGGGALTALGLGGPIGPIAMQGAMVTAIRQAHWGKPIWGTEGGAEMPVLYVLSGVALGLTGPGRYSLDRALDVRVPGAVSLAIGAGVVAGVLITERQSAAAKRAIAEAGSDAPVGAGTDPDQVESTDAAPMPDAGPAPDGTNDSSWVASGTGSEAATTGT
ncbi:MAG: DoxX family protein [Thermomicrobiales bacterium]